jgi:IS30 family transposase
LCWSPEQIAGWLQMTYPNDATMRISHETIYLRLYVQHRRALRGDLRRCLHRPGDAPPAWASASPQGRGQLIDTIPIRRRPAEADGRKVPGHWEGDLVLGKRPSAVLTLVERSSRLWQVPWIVGHERDLSLHQLPGAKKSGWRPRSITPLRRQRRPSRSDARSCGHLEGVGQALLGVFVRLPGVRAWPT